MTRLIDAELPAHRSRPMQVLCLGQSRTGTSSIRAALNQLDYRCWHMADAMADPKRTLRLWSEALVLRGGNPSVFTRHIHDPFRAYDYTGKPWGREEFDAVLGDYTACADNPICEFVDELVAAYPDAKVILTTRDPDSWVKSTTETIGVVCSWQSWQRVAPWDGSTAGPWWEFVKLVIGPGSSWRDGQSPPGLRQAFVDHNDHVRAIVPRERLLEFHPSEGWEPLCRFLGKDVPATPFPNVNDSKDFVKFHRILWWMAVGKMVLKIGGLAALVAAPVAWSWSWSS